MGWLAGCACIAVPQAELDRQMGRQLAADFWDAVSLCFAVYFGLIWSLRRP